MKTLDNYTFSSGNFPVVMTTENFGRTNETTRFVTGVVYSDKLVDDNFYTVGEALGNITVIAERSNGDVYQTTTGTSGGYTLQLPAGQYMLRAVNSTTSEMANLGALTVASTNIKVDVTSDQFNSVKFGEMPNNNDDGLTIAPEDIKLDCNSDGVVSPSDALKVIEHINEIGASYDAVVDINNDSVVSPLDALLVINYLNARSELANLTATPNATPSLPSGSGEKVTEEELDQLASDAIQTVSGWFNDQFATEVVSAKSVEWRNSGLEISNGPTLQVVTPGYQIVVRHGANLFEYRAAKGGSIRYAGYAMASDYLTDRDRGCCPWNLDAPCLIAIDEAIKDLTEKFHSSAA